MQILRIFLTIPLFIVLLFPGCAFPRPAAGIPGRARRELAARGIRLWERNSTVSPADRAPGHILRGRTNIKIEGPLDAADIAVIAESMDRVQARRSRLFRLDLSQAAVTGRSLILDIPSLGSVSLPSGIAEIRIGEEWGTPFLMQAVFPPEGSGTELLSINEAMLGSIVIPAGAGRLRIRSSTSFTVILAEGREHIGFDGAFTETPAGGTGQTGKGRFSIVLVMPSSIKTFSGSLPECRTLYCYAEFPPTASGDGYNCFPCLETVYVPEGSEEAWEEAWFNYCPARFRPLPRSKRTMEAFMNNFL